MSNFKLNENMTKEEVDEKFNEHMKLIFMVMSKVNIKESYIFDKDDLFQEGSIGLLKAIHTYDPSKGYQFSTYACICIRNEILIFLRNQNKDIYKMTSSLDLQMSTDDSDHLSLENILPDETINIEEDMAKNEMILNLSLNLLDEVEDILKKNNRSKYLPPMLKAYMESINNHTFKNGKGIYNDHFADQMNYTYFTRLKYRLAKMIIQGLINIDEKELADKYNRIALVKWKNQWAKQNPHNIIIEID